MLDMYFINPRIFTYIFHLIIKMVFAPLVGLRKENNVIDGLDITVSG